MFHQFIKIDLRCSKRFFSLTQLLDIIWQRIQENFVDQSINRSPNLSQGTTWLIRVRFFCIFTHNAGMTTCDNNLLCSFMNEATFLIRLKFLSLIITNVSVYYLNLAYEPSYWIHNRLLMIDTISCKSIKIQSTRISSRLLYYIDSEKTKENQT